MTAASAARDGERLAERARVQVDAGQGPVSPNAEPIDIGQHLPCDRFEEPVCVAGAGGRLDQAPAPFAADRLVLALERLQDDPTILLLLGERQELLHPLIGFTIYAQPFGAEMARKQVGGVAVSGAAAGEEERRPVDVAPGAARAGPRQQGVERVELCGDAALRAHADGENLGMVGQLGVHRRLDRAHPLAVTPVVGELLEGQRNEHAEDDDDDLAQEAAAAAAAAAEPWKAHALPFLDRIAAPRG